ncbi:NAD(P)-binding protein [Schizopora paradoxa]|uniref:NAD(P)-binding protein n=1 Tax=Schizopora paradoxa TaxID=27342 RepID=A0A0H2S7M9_9AGAM|nr:NAD(P)-binding protein [Schizopora paradoxa]
MSSQLPLVLITGASGFVGSHVARNALDSGYSIRLVARKAKVEHMRDFCLQSDNVDIVTIEDVASGDFSEALKGVGAVIHVASPLAGREAPEGMLKSAVDGTLNVVRQAAAAGIKRIVVTASLFALKSMQSDFHKGEVITPDDWNDVTVEQVLDGSRDSNPIWIYGAVKTIAEQALWKFADEHPEIDITTILPPLIYGPVLPGVKFKDRAALLGHSTIGGAFYENILPENGPQTKLKAIQDTIPLTVDVRDVAKAHILALTAPPTSRVGRKRLLIAGEAFLWKDAVEHLLDVRPELRERLPNPSEARKLVTTTMDVARAREVLGLDSYVDWRKTVEDSVDSLLTVEQSWHRA